MNKALFLLLLFLAFSCSSDEVNNPDGGLFFETHGGKVFSYFEDPSDNTWKDGIKIAENQPNEGDLIIQFVFLYNNSETYCTPAYLGLNDAEVIDASCDPEISIIEQTKNKLVLEWIEFCPSLSTSADADEAPYLEGTLTFEVFSDKLVYSIEYTQDGESDSDIIEMEEDDWIIPETCQAG